MLYQKITVIDPCKLTQDILEQIAKLSHGKMEVYTDYPNTETETIRRIGGSDAVLVSKDTRLTAGVLAKCPNLKYIGMCCSLYDKYSANVDITYAEKNGITVKGVKDYGDEGTVEFIFAQLIYLLKGLGKHQWKDIPTELTGKSLGVIGLGTLGKMVAHTAKHFGMDVYYFSRTRKPGEEAKGTNYLDLYSLLETCDIISTHLPRNTFLLGKEAFAHIKPGSILVNTSLGPTFDTIAFLDWIDQDQNAFAIFDADGAGKEKGTFATRPNIILSDKIAGFSIESRQRLSEKVLGNLGG